MRVLKFEASWCNPCKVLTKTLSEMQINIPIERIDIEDNSNAAMEYGIRSVPTMILLDENNNVVRKVMGAQKKEAIQEFLGEYA